MHHFTVPNAEQFLRGLQKKDPWMDRTWISNNTLLILMQKTVKTYNAEETLFS